MLECNNCGAKSSTAKLGEQHETNACRGYFTVPAPAPSTGTPVGGAMEPSDEELVNALDDASFDCGEWKEGYEPPYAEVCEISVAAEKAVKARFAALRVQLAEAQRDVNRWRKAALYASPAVTEIMSLTFDPTNPEAFAESRRAALDALLAEKDATLAAQSQELARLREALSDAITAIQSGHVASIGSLENTYMPQISKATVERFRAALAPEDRPHE